MNMDTKATTFHEPAKPEMRKAEVVMKICLLVSLSLGALLIILALVGKRSILNVAGDLIPLIMLQWIFYALAKAKKAKSDG